MYVVTLVAFNVFIRIGRFHYVDSRHKTGYLVCWIFVRNNVLDCRTQFDITTLFQPTGNSTVIQIVTRQAFVVEQQRNQFMNVISNQVTFGVDNETAVLK